MKNVENQMKINKIVNTSDKSIILNNLIFPNKMSQRR